MPWCSDFGLAYVIIIVICIYNFRCKVVASVSCGNSVATTTDEMGKPKTCEVYVDGSVRVHEHGRYVRTEGTWTLVNGIATCRHDKCLSSPDPWANRHHADTPCNHTMLSGCGIGIYSPGSADKSANYTVQTDRSAISRIEMLAVRTALLLFYGRSKLVVYTDSQHCIMSLSSHVDDYVNRGWLNINGKSYVAESDIARQCVEIIKSRSRMGRKTDIVKVNAHTGVAGNVIADQLASAAAGGTYSGIVNDDTTYSNGVAITTDNTHDAIIKAGRDIDVDVKLALKMSNVQSIASNTRVELPTVSGIGHMMTVTSDNESKDIVNSSDNSDGTFIPHTAVANVSERPLYDDGDVAIEGQEKDIDETQPPADDNVTYGQEEITSDLSDIVITPMSSSLVCVSCLDTVLIKHRNYKLFDGTDSTIGLTHCRTCVREIHGGKTPDSSLSLAIAGAWINPALLHGSDVCRAVAAVTSKDVTILSAGRRTKYYSCRQVFSLLTRDDEIYALNVDDATITTLRGGFF